MFSNTDIIKKKTLKILCVTSGYELYGSDRSFINSIQAFKKYNLNVSITAILPAKGKLYQALNGKVDSLIVSDLSVLRKSDIRNFKFRNLLLLPVNYIKAMRYYKEYDIVYINTITVIEYILPQFGFYHKNKYIHVREIPIGIERYFFCILLRLSKANLIFNSYETQKVFNKVWVNKAFVLHNGSKGYGYISSLKNSEFDKINILLLGRIGAWKGQDLLVNALSFLSENILKRINIRIVGSVFENNVQYINNLVDIVNKCNLKEIIQIFPFIDKPIQHFKWSHIVTVPSIKPEPFGLVAIEAMSAGRPVIAANHGGLIEIVDDMKTGILFNPSDAKALSDAILYFIENTKKIIEFGEAGRKRYKQYFSLEKYQEKIAEIIYNENDDE